MIGPDWGKGLYGSIISVLVVNVQSTRFIVIIIWRGFLHHFPKLSLFMKGVCSYVGAIFAGKFGYSDP